MRFNPNPEPEPLGMMRTQHVGHTKGMFREPAVSMLKLIPLVTILCLATGASRPDTQPAPGPGIEKAYISFRIGTPQWMPEQQYRDLLALFERHKDNMGWSGAARSTTPNAL